MFITFEGTEGTGKSTLIRTFSEKLKSEGITAVFTREPGGTPLSEKIRELILGNPMDPWTELFLYEAARSEHVMKHILPILQRGETVLCDRFTDSTLAYQAHARGLPWKTVKLLNTMATRKLKPHLTVFLDLDPGKGLARAKDPNRFEEEGVKFQAKVRDGFYRARKEIPSRFLVLNVEGKSPEQLCELVWKRFSKLRAKVRRKKPKDE